MTKSSIKKDFSFADVITFVKAAADGRLPLLEKALEKFDNDIINWSNSENETALIAAAYSGNVATLSFLLEKGADPFLHNENGESALDIVKRLEHPAAATLLKEWMNTPQPLPYIPPITPQIPTSEDIEQFVADARNGNMKWLAYRLSIFGENIINSQSQSLGNTALLLAAFTGQQRVVSFLLRAGADPDVGDHSGCTPLMAACMDNSVRCMALLLEAGADIHARDSDGDNLFDIIKQQELFREEHYIHAWMERREQIKLCEINTFHEGTATPVVVTTKKLPLQKPRPISP